MFIATLFKIAPQWKPNVHQYLNEQTNPGMNLYNGIPLTNKKEWIADLLKNKNKSQNNQAVKKKPGFFFFKELILYDSIYLKFKKMQTIL